MKEKSERKGFTFEISLSVLEHLGRNLYRSFATVLGEAISNSWDANAENVWLYVDRDKDSFYIKDSGDGMLANEFQNKFLKIGYSKRREGNFSPGKKRPYIGRKGIGKLALLSCAERIMVISKKKGMKNYVGGVIDNSGLDDAIKEDLMPGDYPLGEPNMSLFSEYVKDHKKGTIIYFEKIKEGIKNRLEYLKKIIALYFRFSLYDDEFRIFLNDEEITLECLRKLAEDTEFWWIINDLKDPYLEMLQEMFDPEKNEEGRLTIDGNLNGFIASVDKPTKLKIFGTRERTGIDLFVNGRLRERNILAHIPTARWVESYLYGQIHFDSLDEAGDTNDRFTTNREGIKDEDPKLQMLLDLLRIKVIPRILNDWDVWRHERKKKGDPENLRIPPKERAAKELYFEVSKDYELPRGTENKKKVDGWVDDLSDDASFNFASYADCFVSENLIRRYIRENRIGLSPEAIEEIRTWREKEVTNKEAGNISIEIREGRDDLSYLSMDGLANLVDKKDRITEACLARDAREYKPLRDGLAHTARLTEQAKQKLRTVYKNIKGRIVRLLSGEG